MDPPTDPLMQYTAVSQIRASAFLDKFLGGRDAPRSGPWVPESRYDDYSIAGNKLSPAKTDSLIKFAAGLKDTTYERGITELEQSARSANMYYVESGTNPESEGIPGSPKGADRPLRAGWRDAATVGVRGEGIGEAAA